MKKLTKKQKAQFPQYIARIDVLTSARDDYKGLKGYWQGYYTKAMEEQNITAAISKLDEVIETYGEDFYLVDLIGKTEKEDENGYPIYEVVLRSRIRKNCDGSVQAPNWHIADARHGDLDEYEYKWYASEDRYGD